jgi:hypothetical protein
MRHVFEHPLFNHFKVGVMDPVSVLVFDVDIATFHGKEASRGQGAFRFLWFEEASEEWTSFCEFNPFEAGKGNLDGHNFDIVIGLACIPKSVGIVVQCHP